ncbi:MAG: hypothetical protein ACE5HQ_11615 [Gemmatimonadota bacterium]
MPHRFEELKAQTVAQLREIAEGIEHDAVHGYRTMHKEQLVEALCEALGIEAHAHHEVVGIDKSAIKARIRELKKRRDEALAARDGAELKRVRRQIRRLKGKLRRAMV